MKRAVKSIEVELIRIELIKRGESVKALAARMGMHPHSLSSQISENFQDRRTRYRVEAAFDYQLHLWSEVKTLAARKLCFDQHGWDPCLFPVRHNMKRARVLGVRLSNAILPRAKLIDQILAHVASHPNQRTIVPPTS